MLVAAAATGSIVVGAAIGVTATRVVINRAASVDPVVAGWRSETPALPDNPLRAAIARAVRAIRDPAAFPVTAILTLVRADDGDGRLLDGASRYVLQLAVPPAQGWSLTVLDRDAELPDDPHPLSDKTADQRRNGDGSLDIVVQATPPDDPTANWLAVPPGRFRLVLRLYAPTSPGGWRPPAVVRRDSAA